MKPLAQQRIDAGKFAERWKGKGNEKQECHQFWLDLLENVLGMADPLSKVEFEKEVKCQGTTKYIDVYIPSCKLLIEQKSSKVDIASDGPYEQACGYSVHMKYSDRPRYLILSNFKSFRIYDTEVNTSEPRAVIKLSELPKQVHQLNFIVDDNAAILLHEEHVSTHAGKIMKKIYDHFLDAGADPHDLNLFCTRLLFCFFAEDVGIFSKKQFTNAIRLFDDSSVGMNIDRVFRMLNTPYDKRYKAEPQVYKDFPYVNGGLFASVHANANEIIAKGTIPSCHSLTFAWLRYLGYERFDWSTINPTIFGAIFESTLNPETRKANGMHYTSIENIHKVIDPLFLNDLNAEFETIKQSKVSPTQRKKNLAAFQNKLASLTFLDPACGSGNFLTETYMSLRRLENNVIKELYDLGQGFLGDAVTPIKVSINQFYGIEKEDFAVTVAKTALWIAEFQMRQETAAIIKLDDEFLPLHTHGNIVEGNALRMSWEEVVPNVSYIIGNPPFIGTGSKARKPEHSEDLVYIFGKKWRGCASLDYVCGWFKKAFDYMRQSNQTRTALVATNSIKQGRSPRILFTPMLRDNVMSIDFAWETFRWDNDASNKAQVHCVIVGCSCSNPVAHKYIYDGDKSTEVDYINAYLKPEIDVTIAARKKPICKVQPMHQGVMLVDNGCYLFTEEQKTAFLEKEPKSEQYFRKWCDGNNVTHNTYKWCLWLYGCSPAQIKSMPKCYERTVAVKNARKDSPTERIKKLAETPTVWYQGIVSTGEILAMPRVSTKNRDYVPIARLRDILCSDKVQFVTDTSLFMFGMLSSAAHFVWLSNVGGRLKSDFSYSATVYNTFPWPTVSAAQRETIEKTAQAILDARALYPDSTLADLYDPNAMPIELRKAHEANDKAVLKAYGFPTTLKGDDLFRELYKLYQQYIAAEGK